MSGSFRVAIVCVILMTFVFLGCEAASSVEPSSIPYHPATPTATPTASQTPTRDLTASPSLIAAATISPSATPTQCRGFNWAHGTVSPEFISQVQGAMRSAGIEGSVRAGTFGETNSCGTYGARDISYSFTVQVENLQDKSILTSTAKDILGIAHEFVEKGPAHYLERVQLIFQAGGGQCSWFYQNGDWHLYSGEGFIACPGPFSSQAQ